MFIIGILAAIALPKYMTAVHKARYTRVIPLAKAISDAAERHYLAHNTYPISFEGLDISLPEGGTFSTLYNRVAVYTNDNIYCTLDSSNADFMCVDNVAQVGYGGHLARARPFPNINYCLAFTGDDSDRSTKLCKSMRLIGGLQIATTDWVRNTHINGWELK